MQDIQILIVDYGSQYTLVIGRTLRELGFRSAILSPEKANIFLKNGHPLGVILSGSNWSVHNDGAPQLPKMLDISGVSYPILGICYGMQLLAHLKGGVVARPLGHREYGPAKVEVETNHPLFKNVSKETNVWASHGDTVQELPSGFTSIAMTKGIAGMSDEKNRVLGVQFHPEVVDTKEGKTMLRNFLNICGCVSDWNPSNMIHEIQNEVLKLLESTPDKKVILGLSGGVDSTTLATLLGPVLGDKLVCVAIDTGGLRLGEIEELKENAKSAGVKNLVVVEAEDEFIKAISTTTDAQEKRGKFREVYSRIFEEK